MGTRVVVASLGEIIMLGVGRYIRDGFEDTYSTGSDVDANANAPYNTGSQNQRAVNDRIARWPERAS